MAKNVSSKISVKPPPSKSRASRREVEIRMGSQGRLVIPAGLRKDLQLQPGDTLFAHVEERGLVLEKREHILARLQARFRAVPQDVSLVDELIQERRAEARREQGK